MVDFVYFFEYPEKNKNDQYNRQNIDDKKEAKQRVFGVYYIGDGSNSEYDKGYAK